MMSYLSKFVLQMLPTIAATVIGAYIVSTWINPKAPAVGSTRTATWPSNKLAEGHAKPVEPADAPAPAIEQIVEDARAADGSDRVRVIPIVKGGSVAAVERPAAVSHAVAAPVEDRKTATELASDAIQRLRGETDAAPAEAAIKPASVARHQPARPVLTPLSQPQPVSQPIPVAVSAPPLPPATTIGGLNSPRVEPAVEMPLVVTRSERLTPPADVPTASNPLSLQASNRGQENPSVADGFLSATKSFFRAITPPEFQR